MSSVNWPDDSVFEPFTVFEETYKTVSTHAIKAAVLIPKSLLTDPPNPTPTPRPVILNIHGGFYATGHALFAPFFMPWALDLALAHAAVIVSADYRLLPSPNGVADQLSDLNDFWTWTRAALPEILRFRYPDMALDFGKVLLTGGSAGGYYATQLALSHPDEVRALAMSYPGLDLNDGVFVNGPERGAPSVLRFPESEIPGKEEALEWVRGMRRDGGVVRSKGGFEVTPFAVGLAQHGVFAREMFGVGDGEVGVGAEYLPGERVRGGARLPKALWIIHGDDDSCVYIRQSENFINLVREKLPETEVRFDVAVGRDHAFDVEPAYWEPYAKDAMQFVVKGWLG